MVPFCQAPREQFCLGGLAERRQTCPSLSVKKKPLLIVYRKSTNYNCVNKNVEEIVENFESFRRDKSYIQNAIATVQGALKKKIKERTIGHDPGSRNPNRSRSQHILYAGRKVD